MRQTRSFGLWSAVLTAALDLAIAGCSSSPSGSVSRTSPDPPRVSVLTQHYDNARTGANLQETELTPDVVRSGFGYLFSLPVDGLIYAQPLYVADLELGPLSGAHDVLYVATEHDSVYAFEANQPGPPLWQTSLGIAAPVTCFPQKLLTPEIGITGTPVIDPVTRTLYVVAFTTDDPTSCAPSNFHHLLYALDLVTGVPKMPPVELAAATPIPFTTSDHLQRSGLLLANGVIYIAFASHADHEPYHGWVLAYDAATLTPRASFVDTPTGDEGGIWMSGQAPAVDENGHIYLSTGNGTFDGGANFGDSVLALALDGNALTIADWFTPHNQAELQALDLDLGSMGLILIPGSHTLGGVDRHLLAAGDKQGLLYLLDRDRLGGYHPNGDQVLQTLTLSAKYIDGGPVWFDDGTRPKLYVYPSEADLQALALADSPDGSYLTPASTGTVPRTKGLPGGFLALSANGISDGIVWANHPWSADPDGDANAITKVVPGVLRAFDAEDVSVELWNNRADPSAPADAVGNFAKFCPPIIANGKVYLAAWQDDPEAPAKVIVYGKLP